DFARDRLRLPGGGGWPARDHARVRGAGHGRDPGSLGRESVPDAVLPCSSRTGGAPGGHASPDGGASARGRSTRAVRRAPRRCTGNLEKKAASVPVVVRARTRELLV